MYRKESIKDGILGWQDTPDGEWNPYSKEQLTDKIKERNLRIEGLTTVLDYLKSQLKPFADCVKLIDKSLTL